MNKMIRNLILGLLCGGVTAALTSCHDDDNNGSAPVVQVEETVLNVDIILPADIRSQWQNAIDWAQENIALAQTKQTRRVRLNLRYHDEDTEDLDALGYKLTHPSEGDDTCHAIVGPYHSDNATTFLQYAEKTRLPVVMPTCTSAELQRTNARNTYAWFLTESDITQCEIMLSAAKAMGATDAALIYSDDTYGQSFRDWFAYYAAEQEIGIAGAPIAYKRGQDLTAFLQKAAEATSLHAIDREGYLVVLIALSDVDDITEATLQCEKFQKANPGMELFDWICSDTSCDDRITYGTSVNGVTYGITPFGSMAYGFPQSYAYRYLLSNSNVNGLAQVYDALTLIALGAALQQAMPDGECYVDGKQVEYYVQPYGPTLTDYMRSIVASATGEVVHWDAASLATGFSELAAGRLIDLNGATGSLYTDSESHTKVLNTSYMLWMMQQGRMVDVLVPVLYLSTTGTGSDASTTVLWERAKNFEQVFDDDDVSHALPSVTDHWAVVISPSTTWSNYRHQADAFAMYQTLRHHGYDDDHIVLIVEDNLANNSSNLYPGEIFVERSDDPDDTDSFVNDNVRKNAVVDYHFSDLQPQDIADIMLGRSSDRLPHVIHPTESSDVLFFWSGHGGSREGPLWGDEDAGVYFGTQRILDIVAQMAGSDGGQRTYRRLMFAIETCYSGKWGEALAGQPDVLVLTAATPYETSKADVYDRELGVYLSNAFSRTFRRKVATDNAISIYDLYKALARTTNGSHVSIYNQQEYGSVYTMTMRDYLPK